MRHHLVAQAVRIIDQHDRERVYRLERDEEVCSAASRSLREACSSVSRAISASTTPKPIRHRFQEIRGQTRPDTQDMR